MEIQNKIEGNRPPRFQYRILFFILRAFFKLLYHQFAWTYDWVAAIVSLGLWQKWILSVLPYIDGVHVLELGHGPGHLQAALHRKGIAAIGVDESPQMGKIAYRRLTQMGLTPRLVNGHGQLIPFVDESFHQVVATFPAEYILDKRTIEEIYRVLIPGGTAILLPLAWITGRKLLDRLAAWLFYITGEAPSWNDRALEPIKKMGFEAWSEFIDLESSKVLIIHMQKPCIAPD